MDDAVSLLRDAKKVIVVTGAGISTSLGIPDFRSEQGGLYAKLRELGLGLSDPQEVFDVELFREDPGLFYSVAKEILPCTKRFTPTHAFVSLLQDRGVLEVNYTQNIDNIEGYAGIEAGKLVQCHGSFATATCQRCGDRVAGEEIHGDIKAGRIPRCAVCIRKTKLCKPAAALKRKRSSDHRNRSAQRRYQDLLDDDDDDDDDEEEEEDFTEQPGVMKVSNPNHPHPQPSIRQLITSTARYHLLRRAPPRHLPRPPPLHRLLSSRPRNRNRHQPESRSRSRNPQLRSKPEQADPPDLHLARSVPPCRL